MKREKVESSQIESIGYDPEKSILQIEFKGKTSNPIYNYLRLDAETFTRLMAAESKGKFLGQWIKGKFEFEKIGTAESERIMDGMKNE